MSSSTLSERQAVADATRGRPKNFRIWAGKVALLLTILLVGGELVSRAFWMFDRHAPLLSRKSLLYAYYPQLRTTGVENTGLTKPEGAYDILILGGSTISAEYGAIDKQIAESLEKRLDRPVRVFNLACAAHNSQDSMLKYRWLADQRFDLVVVYDGFNDARMNNAPPDVFRADYSHCHWYQCVNRLDEHPVLLQSALPFTLLFAADRCAGAVGLTQYIPREQPSAAWIEHAKDIRTRATYQRNLREIITAASERHERVVVMTFAYHIPANYSLVAFVAGELDYSDPNACPVELTGKPAYVIAALEQHNDAVRELAAQHPGVVFVDQDRLMVRGRKNFEDCCHLTPAGCTQFAENILAALEK